MKTKVLKILFSIFTLIMMFIAIISISNPAYATTDCSGHNTEVCYDYVFSNGCCHARHATVPLNQCQVWCE